jgi:hypothetical protein
LTAGRSHAARTSVETIPSRVKPCQLVNTGRAHALRVDHGSGGVRSFVLDRSKAFGLGLAGSLGPVIPYG